jgi:hypothetical protein
MLVVSDRLHDANPPTPSVSQLTQMVNRRLAITQIGLAEAHRRLEAGQSADATLLLEKIDEDLHLLRCRVHREVERLAPRPAELHGSAN